MEAAISIVLIEDEDLVRTSVRTILERSGFAVVAEAADATGGIEATLRERPQVCLIDVRLPDANGIEVTRRLAQELPDTALVVYSASERHEDLVDAIRAGAVGYLLKGMDPTRLTHALRGVVEGEAAIPRPLMAALVKELQTQGRRKAVIGLRSRVELTRREWEVLDLLCEGLDTRQIAGRLTISPVTVRRHVSEILRKLGAGDRAEAIALVEGRL
ncbi:MAG TPA: response regulator transcription factor [Solirubrobacterales bacterium]|nr:response regulator transcription factor [Solirubrobacterales bacterium]